MATMPTPTTPPHAAPVANPTWYGQIRDMFTSVDRAHMAAQGLDLASYTEVVKHAGDIYQQVAAGNMPMPTPWPQDWVQTFFNWMTHGYPKGTPPAPGVAPRFLARASLFQAASAPPAATRIRKNINALSAAELALLKKAFAGIMALPATDPNSYFAQAGYHWYPSPNTYCMHHVPGYNPWHRAYMLSFENALRSVPGCEQVTLPYWDITTPLPAVLQAPPFDQYVFPQDVELPDYPKGYVTHRFDDATIAANLLKYQVSADIQRALSKTDWEDFHGFWGGASYNTIIAAHDGGHNSIGPTMQDQGVAAFDPVFWFFHCNWDRLFWAWQKRMAATDLHGLMTTIDQDKDPISYQLFTAPALGTLNPFTEGPPKLNAVDTIDSAKSLDVDYDAIPQAPVGSRTRRSVLASQRVSVDGGLVNVRVAGVNRLKIPGSFSVHLQKDGVTLASRALFQPVEVAKCANCVSNAIVHFDFELPLAAVQGGKLSVWVEPANTAFIGDRFPQKLMGNPTIEVHLPLHLD